MKFRLSKVYADANEASDSFKALIIAFLVCGDLEDANYL